MRIYRYFLIAVFVIIVDHVSKLLVYNNMYLHQEINLIGEWFRLHYLLNPGMAFGLRWESEFGKLALTIFRIGAMGGIGWYLLKSVERNAHYGFLICLALILGGAVGNVIDSIFYGVLLNNAPEGSPTPWFHGQVIDMLFFPMFEFQWPNWFPMIGGDTFLFFSPVFNVADSSIFIGVVSILIFQKKFFSEDGSEINISESHTSKVLMVGDNRIELTESPDVPSNSASNQTSSDEPKEDVK
ncbi:lipoprotein signal peptidase [soil metagenome]